MKHIDELSFLQHKNYETTLPEEIRCNLLTIKLRNY